MRALIRDFTASERVLLLILGILTVGVAYYYLVQLEVSDAIASAHAERDTVAAELDSTLLRAAKLKKMEKEMEELDNGRSYARMESYNNSKAEIALLNDILTVAKQYSVTATELTRSGNQIRRSFALTFTVDSYDTALDVITRLSDSACRCLLGDVNCVSKNGGTVNFSVTATFFETLVDGTPDAGLPADEASAVQKTA